MVRNLRIEVERAGFRLLGAGVLRKKKCRQRGNISRQCRGIEGHAAMVLCFAAASAKPIRILTKKLEECSPRDLRAIGLLRRTPINTFEHITKLGG